jgi:hypothetical protein
MLNSNKRKKVKMSNKKIQDNIDKLEIKIMYGRVAKHRCPKCHRFSLFIKNKEGKVECIRCHKIIG